MKYLLKIFTGIIITSLLFSSCKKAQVELPGSLQEIIKNSKDCQCNPYIQSYIWNGELTYMSSCGGPACSCTQTYFSEDGARIELPANYSFDKFLKESKFVGTVWQCK